MNLDSFKEELDDYFKEKIVKEFEKLCKELISKYEVKKPTPSPEIKKICEYLKKKHEELKDKYPEEFVKEIFKKMWEVFKKELSKQLKKLGVTNDGGEKYKIVKEDLNYLVDVIKSLEGLSDLDLNWEEIWNLEHHHHHH
uniref:S2hlx_EX_19 n=1 Tax=Mus musculus TaxID=10090 RepID=UPI0028FC3398|nr:Chain A, S2hlx_EX_19 [Mus musculus]8F5H_B Chain B, S2hlx_EX_19 [Mus musculus]